MKSMNPKRKPVETVAIIPARGGQQSIHYKNLQKLGGKTLLQWAIEVAFKARAIDAVIVSTEDVKISAEAKKHGAIVAPRPRKYSQPDSGDAGWYYHAVTWLEEEFGWTPEYLVNLRPTSPLRFAEDIDTMITTIKKTGADGLKSVIPAPLHPYKMWQLIKSSAKNSAIKNEPNRVGDVGKLVSLYGDDYKKKYGPDQPRQIIQNKFPVFFQDGQVDITRRKFILRPECLEFDNVWGENLQGYVLDPRTSTDLDEPSDFIAAEKIYKQLKKEKKL